MTRASGREGLDRRGDAAGQPAAADRHEDGGDVGQVLGDLEPDGALAGDDPVVVVRRDDGEPALGGDALGDLLALLGRRADDDDLGAVGGDPVALDAAGRRDGMTTTAGAPSRRAARATPWAWLPDEYVMTPARARVRRQAGDGVVGAAELERPDRLEALGLEALPGVGRPERDERRPERDPAQAGRGRGCRRA